MIFSPPCIHDGFLNNRYTCAHEQVQNVEIQGSGLHITLYSMKTNSIIKTFKA